MEPPFEGRVASSLWRAWGAGLPFPLHGNQGSTMMKRAFLSIPVLLLMAGCASGSSAAGSGRDRNLITRDEIEEVPTTTAYDLLERLRPTWLRNRGPTSITTSGVPVYPVVYVDEVRSGGLETLFRISSQIIREMRFVNGRDATTKWGMDHGGGVILILTGR